MRSHLAHLGAALATMLVAFLIYGIAYATVARMSAEVAQLDSEIKAQTETAGRVALARTALAELEANEMQVQSHFVSEKDVVRFINDMEGQGGALGSAVSVSSVESVVWQDRPALMFALTVDGSFDAVMRTVGAIEHAPYALSLTGFSIGQEGEGNWRARIEMRVGSVPAEPAASPTATHT